MYKKRYNAISALPTSVADIVVNGEWTETSTRQPFVLADDDTNGHMLILSIQKNLTRLAAADTVHPESYPIEGLRTTNHLKGCHSKLKELVISPTQTCSIWISYCNTKKPSTCVLYFKTRLVENVYQGRQKTYRSTEDWLPSRQNDRTKRSV